MKRIPIQGNIPLWRIVIYSLIIMAGVNYLATPEGDPILGWLFVLFAGFFIAGYCLYLNWIQTDRARDWINDQPLSVKGIRALHIVPRLMIKLRNIITVLRSHRDLA